MKNSIFILLIMLLFGCGEKKEDTQPQAQYLAISLQPDAQFQTIHNFGASDAWSCQFVGKNWPLAKREAIADYLFSQSVDSDGSPKGIGLNAWRFNIGAGSAAQGGSSNISDEWRRAEGFLQADGSYDWAKQEGQRWFLKAAQQRGVETFIGFVNSPPVALTENGKAYSGGGSSANLAPENFDDYADFLSKVITQLKTEDGIQLDYVSPFNEPQWDWDHSGQEGSPWLNDEIADVVRELNQKLKEQNIATLIEIPEAGQIEYLYKTHNRPGRANQIEDFFLPTSANYFGNLEKVAPKVAAHSYYSTWNPSHLIETRNELSQKLEAFPNLEYWMTEYTLLEDNAEVKGNGRDLGMDPALYMARVIHADLTVANANAWQWWLAVSPYDYKDGLVYIDWNKSDGQVYDSKMLWTLGNYSRFIEPGMVRVGVRRGDNRGIEQTLNGVMIASFIHPDSQKTVSVALNYGTSSVPIKIDVDGEFIECSMYRTSAADDLRKIGTTSFNEAIRLAPRSVTTFVEN